MVYCRVALWLTVLPSSRTSMVHTRTRWWPLFAAAACDVPHVYHLPACCCMTRNLSILINVDDKIEYRNETMCMCFCIVLLCYFVFSFCIAILFALCHFAVLLRYWNHSIYIGGLYMCNKLPRYDTQTLQLKSNRYII